MPYQNTTRPKIIALWSAICAIWLIFAAIAVESVAAQVDTGKTFGILAGAKLNDGRLMATVGGSVTHSNGFSSVFTVDLRNVINAVQYNAVLRLTTRKAWTISAVLGPNVEAPIGDLTSEDRLVYLMLASGAAITWKPYTGMSISLVGWYLFPAESLAPFKIAVVTHWRL